MNGLPSNEVYHMYQDKNGLLWFATDRGICSYNGYSFRTYGLKDGMTSTTIFKFYPQVNGDIWCSTVNNRFFYFHPDESVFHEYEYNNLLAEISKDAVNDDLFIDKNGTVHVSYINLYGEAAIGFNGKLIHRPYGRCQPFQVNMESTGEEDYAYVSRQNKVLSRDYAVEKFEFRHDEMDLEYHKVFQSGDIKLISDHHSVYYIENNDLKKTINSGSQPIGLGMFDKDHFWVGYKFKGLVIYDLNGNEVQSYLVGKSVSGVLSDHEKGVWISTISDGVFYSTELSVQCYPIEKESHIVQLSIDPEQKLIVSYNNGHVYTKRKNGFEISKESKSRVQFITEFYQSINAQIYFNTEDTKNLFFESKSKKEVFTLANSIVKLSDESEKPPILCSHLSFYIVKPNYKLSEYPVNGRVNDACLTENNLFIAMHDGLYHYDTITKTQHKIKSKLLNYQLDDIDFFGNRGVIAATRGGGVVIVNNDKIWAITESEGLTSNMASQIYIQNDSVAWICTIKGLNRITFGEGNMFNISKITQFDGLIDSDVTDVEIIENTVWVATRSGLCSFGLDFFNKKWHRPSYYLKILSKKVNGKIKSSLTHLEHWQNKIEFNFESISFKKNELLRYRYKIEGLDDHWNYTSALKIVYESLPPGDYKFVLQVGTEGLWNGKTIRIPFIIHPPFYRTFWFRLVIFVGISGLIILFFKFRIFTYNRDISREILRQILKRLKGKSSYFVVNTDGKKIRIDSSEVLYVKSYRNYIEIHRNNNKGIVIRNKISNFLSLVPDPLEYLQINRSYIIRIDKVTAKSKDTVTINDVEIKVGNTYLEALSRVYL